MRMLPKDSCPLFNDEVEVDIRPSMSISAAGIDVDNQSARHTAKCFC